MKAVIMRAAGGPGNLSLVDRSEPEIGPDQVLVEVALAGVNFMDIGVRQGQFWQDMPNPKTLGVEGVGRVVAMGANVEAFRHGDRVAWAYAPGSYAQRVAIAADALVAVPDAIDDRTAASVMMQGLTAKHFATDFHPVQPGEIALVHAASGGVGMMLSQIVRLRGGTAIGRVSHQEKVAAAVAAGAHHVIVAKDDGFAEEVMRLTDGEGVHVVFDGSGSATFDGSIESLRRSGTLCWFGPGLGKPPALDIYGLPKSIKVGYAAFFDHVHTPELLRAHANELFGWIMDGTLRVQIGGTYDLADAALAHTEMEERRHTGKLLLKP